MTRVRVQRIAEQMKKEVADIIRTEIKHPRIGFVTVTRVEVTGDLQHAKVFVSVLGDDNSKRESLAALNKAVGFIRGEVGRRLRMRLTPELQFRLDESGEYSAHIEAVLKQLRQSEAPDQPTETGDNRE